MANEVFEILAEKNINLFKRKLFLELISECNHATSKEHLSFALCCKLKRLDKAVLQEIVSYKHDGCAPLFIACKNGNFQIVDHLLGQCYADVEQRGRFDVPEDKSVHTVTPLWCAAVTGHLDIVKCLVSHGANINSVSDTGSTPVRSACFMTHYEVVYYLVQCGADIRLPNFSGGTCLINSVQSVPLCKFLLKHGADVNAQDIQKKTALHYAIQEHRLETTLLLLKYGADATLRSRSLDDALQIACLEGTVPIFEFLVQLSCYTCSRVADAYELMGCTFLDEHHDLQAALLFWKQAFDIRSAASITKKVLPPCCHFQYVTEFTTLEELEALAADLDLARLHSLLICRRILGSQHKDLAFRLMYRGATYADSLCYQRCCNLWQYALELRIAKDTILYSDTYFTAQALTRLFLDLPKYSEGFIREAIQFYNVYSVLEMLVKNVPQAMWLVARKPLYLKHEEGLDRILRICLYLVYILLKIELSCEQDYMFKRLLHEFVQMKPRTSSGDTLLHLAVTKSTVIQNNSVFDEFSHLTVFPSSEVVQLLLECGSDVDAMNKQSSTPLLLASISSNYNPEVVDILLKGGAHIDTVNENGMRPSILLQNSHVNVMKYTSLQCLSARIVSQENLVYRGAVPPNIGTFIRLH